MYWTNSEYRAAFRKYFNMNVADLEEKYAHLKDTDPISYDELLYDEDAVNRGMADILEKTRDKPLFKILYTIAAARLISEDIETGLCVLLTYDFFADFIKVYEHPSITSTTDCYLDLKQKL